MQDTLVKGTKEYAEKRREILIEKISSGDDMTKYLRKQMTSLENKIIEIKVNIRIDQNSIDILDLELEKTIRV